MVANGFVELSNGMNSSRDPVLLQDTQCSRALNATFRGGLASTRPAFVEYDKKLPEGIFRGMGVWSLESGDLLVMVIGSAVYTLKLDTGDLIKQHTFPSTSSQCFFVQAAQFFVVQDGVGSLVALEDTHGTPAPVTEAPSLPPGTVGVYAHGRIHYVPLKIPLTDKSGRAVLISSDIMRPLEPETVLNFIEGEVLAEGGGHAMPLEAGFIGGLGVFRNSQTGTGMGAVIVLGRTGVCAFDFSVSRDLWKDQALSQVLFMGSGCRSPWAVVNLNDDLIYRGTDGLRTIRYTTSGTAGSSGALSNVPLSTDVADFMGDNSQSLNTVSMATYDNRLYCTVMPTGAVKFRGLLAWDVAASFYSGAQGGNAYDGLWTGCTFAQVAMATLGQDPRLFAMDAGNKLYFLGDDVVRDPNETRIETRIETRAFNFGDLVTLKKLEYVNLWVQDIPIDTEFKLWYRPHGYPLWKHLATRMVYVPAGSLPQSRRRLRFNLDLSLENCDPVTGQPLYLATAFQIAIQWTGRATIGGVQVMVEPQAEQPPDPCDDAAGHVLGSSEATGDTLDDFSYSFKE